MQSKFQFIISVCTGVVLVLASCMLVAPLLAILVAAACVGSAWVLLQLDWMLHSRRRLDFSVGDRRLILPHACEETRP
ncbi:MAG: hypothetical protein JJT88_02720 [Gammaproteobacteria bacterium]|nr:hypothetical protein [Gammaproteobacteria bacterium]